MGKSFLPDAVNQSLLFPPSLHDWLPAGHLARFLVDVASALDLSAVYGSYEEKDGRGGSAYALERMVRGLLYGYATGVYSSRKIEARLKQEIVALLKQAEDVDAAEIARYGKGQSGNELPEELRRRESRLKKIAQAKAELGQEAREKTERERAEGEAKLAARREEEQQTGKKKRGREPQVPGPDQAQPEATAQRNFTDPERRIMPDGANKGSFVQSYNAQAAADSAAQVIVAAGLTQKTVDNHQLLPMLKQVEENLGRRPEKVSAGTGYWSEANVTDESVTEIDLHIATGRNKHEERVAMASGPPPDGATAKEARRNKLRTEAGRAVYKMRKAIVEPVFGPIKEQRGFRRFSLRGLNNVRCAWRLVCAVSNLRKLFAFG